MTASRTRRTLATIALLLTLGALGSLVMAPAASADTAEDGSTVSASFYDDLGEGLVRTPDGGITWAPGYGPNGQKPGYLQAEDGTWVPASYTGKCYYVDYGPAVAQSYWDSLLTQGWKGHADDGLDNRVYSPGC